MSTDTKAKTGPSYLRRENAEIWKGDHIVALAVGDESEADEMVCRYNAHDGLVEACTYAQVSITGVSRGGVSWYRGIHDNAYNLLEAALAAAEKLSPELDNG